MLTLLRPYYLVYWPREHHTQLLKEEVQWLCIYQSILFIYLSIHLYTRAHLHAHYASNFPWNKLPRVWLMLYTYLIWSRLFSSWVSCKLNTVLCGNNLPIIWIFHTHSNSFAPICNNLINISKGQLYHTLENFWK